MLKIKIAVLNDLHYGSNILCGECHGDISDILLLRAVHRLNRFIKPDVTLIPGDLIQNAVFPGAKRKLQRLREIFDLLKSPWIVLPGNNDGDATQFYSVMPKPAKWIDIGEFRFIPFIDEDRPEYNAHRSCEDIDRMSAARAGHPGPLIAFQHMSLHRPGSCDCTFNLTNADEVLDSMRKNRVMLSIGAHFHKGVPLMQDEGVQTVVSPALAESPFPFLEINIDGSRIQTIRHELRMNPNLSLFDNHIHTPFAYCNDNMDIPLTVDLARRFGLGGITFTEHLSHLYLDREKVQAKYQFVRHVETLDNESTVRVPAYLKAVNRVQSPFARVGIEMDCVFNGKPFIRASDIPLFHIRLGAVHCLKELLEPQPDYEKVCDEFLSMIAKLAGSDIHILAHPFRVFKKSGMACPVHLIKPVIQILRENKIAAEVNFHTNEPPAEFIRECIESGVKLSFGSDAHNLYEIGEFTPHLALLRSLGYTGDISDLLIKAF